MRSILAASLMLVLGVGANAWATPEETATVHSEEGLKSAASAKHHAPAEKADCAQILSESEPEEHSPEVSDVVFHHVADSYVISFESPVSHHGVNIDLKKLQCRLLHTNGVVKIGGHDIDFTPTKHTVWMWVAAVIMLLVFTSNRPKKDQLTPRGIGTVLEVMVLFVRDDIARKNIPGTEADRYTPYLLSCFFFILIMNCLGLVPYAATATSNLAVTLGLTLFTFILTQAASIRSAGVGGFLKHLTGGVHPVMWPIMVPVEVLGIFTKPFALTVRLFANMIAGHIVIFFLLGLIFIFKSVAVAPVSMAFAIFVFMIEILVAGVQAFIFTTLSALFIGMGVSMGHHDPHHQTNDAHEKTLKQVVHH